MAKTLKDFLNERQLGPMVVKNPDEQKFIDKHVTAKTQDRNGNGDDVFNAANVKKADRKKERHGYEPGEDEKVYEALKGDQHKIDANKNGKVDAHDFHLLRKKKKVAEEAEELEELSKATLGSYVKKATIKKGQADFEAGKSMARSSWKSLDKNINKSEKRERGINTAVGKLTKEEVEELEELSTDTLNRYKTAATADANQAHRQIRTGPGRPNRRLLKRTAGGYAATRAIERQSKKTNEEAEQIDELSKKTLGSYVIKSLAPSSEKSVSNLASKGGYKLGQARDDDYTAGEKEDAKSVKRSLGVLTAVRKMTKEEAELEEKLDMKKASMGTVVKDFQKSDAPQFQGKSQKKRQAMAVAAKLTAERGKMPMNKEQRLLALIGDLSETHQRTMTAVFDKLNEDNQRNFLAVCDTPEGIEKMLDFSIQNRGA
jgi:hypothetical protein